MIHIIQIIKSTFDPGDIISSLQTIIAALIFIFKSVQLRCDYYSDYEAFKIWFHTLSCPSSFCPHLSRGILAATKVTVTFCTPDDFHESDGPLNLHNMVSDVDYDYDTDIEEYIELSHPRRLLADRPKNPSRQAVHLVEQWRKGRQRRMTVTIMTTMKIRTMIISP